MNKYLLILIVLFSNNSFSQNIVLPKNATPLSEVEMQYSAFTNQSFDEVLSSWIAKSWKEEGSLIWDLGDYVNIKNIKISSDINFNGQLKNVVNNFLSRVNRMNFAKENNLVVFSCLYSNKHLVIKTSNKSTFMKGARNEKCN